MQRQIQWARNNLLQQIGTWRRSNFVQDVAILASGIAAAQVAVAAAPVLTWLYTPDDLGIFALFASIGAGLTVAASWPYELAITAQE
jgi:hypothetical protein